MKIERSGKHGVRWALLMAAAVLLALSVGGTALAQGPDLGVTDAEEACIWWWCTPTATPTPGAEEPTPTPTPAGTGIEVRVEGPEEALDAGSTFTVGIIAYDVPDDLYVYGAQFELSFDHHYLSADQETLQVNPAMNPVFVGASQVDNGMGHILYAFSRQGDVPGLNGDVLLATVEFTALESIEEDVCTTIAVETVLLGDPDANNIGVDGVVNKEICVVVDKSYPLDGYVYLQGPPDGKWDGTTVNVISATLTTTTDVNGYFKFDAVPEYDKYIIEATAPGYLRALCPDFALTEPTTLEPVTLLAGDINGDDAIDVLDATAIGIAFGQQSASEPPGPYLATDLNRDGIVNVFDLILMAGNYGAEGEIAWAAE